MYKKNLWESYNEDDCMKLEKVNKAYKEYLNIGKTERECIKETVRQAEKAGYKDLREIIEKKEQLKQGEDVYKRQVQGFRIFWNILCCADQRIFR